MPRIIFKNASSHQFSFQLTAKMSFLHCEIEIEDFYNSSMLIGTCTTFVKIYSYLFFTLGL